MTYIHEMTAIALLFLSQIPIAVSLIPPRFQWNCIDYAWPEQGMREAAISSGDYIPASNMPTGIARWRDKLFITIPRWRKGVPSSLNYIDVNGAQTQPLHPYPSWSEGFVHDTAPRQAFNTTIVSTFRVHVDSRDRLWVVDNGVCDMANGAKQVSPPAILVFNLIDDTLLKRFVLPDNVSKDESVFSSIIVDIISADGEDTYAYITDMGSNAIVVYSLKDDDAWRVEHPFFNFDPKAATFRVGGIDFYWNDGVSSAALSNEKQDGYKNLYLQPTSSTKLFKMSTKFLRNKNVNEDDLRAGVVVVGDKGPKSQTTACAFDPFHNILFFTQVSKNGVGCWNVGKKFSKSTTPLVFSDCRLLEFPNDIKVDENGNVWILSDCQSRFLYSKLDLNEVNFRVLTAPAQTFVNGTECADDEM